MIDGRSAVVDVYSERLRRLEVANEELRARLERRTTAAAALYAEVRAVAMGTCAVLAVACGGAQLLVAAGVLTRACPGAAGALIVALAGLATCAALPSEAEAARRLRDRPS